MCHSPTDPDNEHPHEFLACSDAYWQRWYECSWPARSGEEMVSDNRAGVDRTHIEDDEDSVELRVPNGNCLLIVPRVKKSGGRIAPALLDDLILYFRDGPGIESMMGRRTRSCNIAGSTHVLN